MFSDISYSALLILLSTAIFFVSLFRKIGLSSILGYLCSGILLGPSVFGIVLNPESILHFAEFGVVLLLFLIGLELDSEKLIQMKKQILGAGLSQMLLSSFFLFFILFLFSNLDNKMYLIFAITLSLSSTALASQLLDENDLLASPLGRLGFSILLFQDLAVVFLLFLLNLQFQESVNQTSVWVNILSVILLIFPGKYVLNKLLYWITKNGNRDIITAFSLFIISLVSFLMHSAGLSSGLGAFLAGIFLANSQYRHQLETDIEPFKGLFLGLFFMAIGMSMNISLFIENWFFLFFITLGFMIFKSLIVAVIIKFYKYSWKKSYNIGITLSQGGEFGFIVVNQLLSFESIDKNFAQNINLIIGLSMFLTPILYRINRFFYREISQNKESKKGQDKEIFMDNQAEVIIAGFGRFSQIAGRIFLANNIPFVAIDKDIKQVNFINKFGNKIYYGDANRLDILRQAGIENAKVLIIGIDNPEDCIKISKMVLENYPETHIITRAKDRKYAYKLQSLEKIVVIRELFESGLEVALNSLRFLGYSDSQALGKIDSYRNFDNRSILESIQYQDDEDKLVEFAKKKRQELKKLYSED